ncbi:hypothetical protein MJO29_010126 [Puccinia striiformis f. sp. tritici]|nr:hypothetical protein MJO29_010126 [Puccinia striiformis f. sp. tritici]
MVFCYYSPDIKYVAVTAALQGKNLAGINASLGANISHDSMSRWSALYERTRAVVCDPATYEQQGRPLLLDDDALVFIKDLVHEKPAIYADEIQYSLAEQHGIRVSVSTILNTLHKRLNMSKKTMRTIHPKQDPLERAHYIYQVGVLPTDYLVFTGKLSLNSYQ